MAFYFTCIFYTFPWYLNGKIIFQLKTKCFNIMTASSDPVYIY